MVVVRHQALRLDLPQPGGHLRGGEPRAERRGHGALPEHGHQHGDVRGRPRQVRRHAVAGLDAPIGQRSGSGLHAAVEVGVRPRPLRTDDGRRLRVALGGGVDGVGNGVRHAIGFWVGRCGLWVVDV